MAISTTIPATTNFHASSGAPTVPVPAEAAVGDRLYAWCSYAGRDGAVTVPAGWTELVNVAGQDALGKFVLAYRAMATGVTAATFAVSAVDVSTGVYAKSVLGMVSVNGGSAHTVGTPVVRPSSGTTTVVPGVTVPTGGLLLVFAGDRGVAQTNVTAPTGMTEEAKYLYTGGGAPSVIIASQFTSGASGTKTVTYSAANVNAAGVAVAITAASGTPPTVSAGADATIAAGTTRAFAGTQTGATSVAWTQVSGPATVTITSPTTLTASVTPSVSGVYVFRLTGTNGDGSSFDEMTLTVSGTTSRPVGTISNPAGFVPVNSDSVESALADGSDATYIEAEVTAGDAVTVAMAPLDAGAGYQYTYRARTTVAPVNVVQVALLQGATVIATRTQTLTTSMATYTVTLSSAEASAITNRSDLRIRLTVQS